MRETDFQRKYKEIERITLAFNMSGVKEWENLNNLKWVNKN